MRISYRRAAEFFTLGVVVGFVLGGSQALSRSFYGSMVPEEASAEFFGFYTVFSKFSAIWGPLIFGVIRQWAGSARLAIVSLIVFFVAGLLLLAFVDEKKARLAKESGAFCCYTIRRFESADRAIHGWFVYVCPCLQRSPSD